MFLMALRVRKIDPVEMFQVAMIRDDLAMELASAQVILERKQNNAAGNILKIMIL